jgi:hypothetical protein
MLYLDIPAADDLADLAAHRGAIAVSIYLPTTPLTQAAAADRIALRNLARDAIDQLEAAGADKRRVAEVAEHLADLVDDDEFWRFQAHTLAIFVTPDNLRFFRLANELQPLVMVADRFHLKPLLRSVSFCHACYVLALAEGSVRLIEVSADLPASIAKVEGLPRDAASAVGEATLNDRSPSGRIMGSEGKKVRLRQFARKVDGALRGLLAGSTVPLVLAAVDSLAAIYRSVNTYPHLASRGIDGSPERMNEADLAAAARAVLDDLHRAEIEAWIDRFQQRANQGRATTDIAHVARAATFGAVDSLLVDMDQAVHGTIDDDGRVTFAETGSASTYGIVDEIASRVIQSGGQVLSVRQQDIPEGKPLAAILRYPV